MHQNKIYVLYTHCLLSVLLVGKNYPELQPQQTKTRTVLHLVAIAYNQLRLPPKKHRPATYQRAGCGTEQNGYGGANYHQGKMIIATKLSPFLKPPKF
jgi:hypothetical protein